METHSAIGHLHHWAVQRERQGELFSAYGFALRLNVSMCLLNGYYLLLLFLYEIKGKTCQEE